MKTPVWKSRKFGLLFIDLIAALLTLWVTYLVPDEQLRNLIFGTYAAIQPVVAFVVWGIATEDKAQIVAGTHPSQSHIDGDNVARDKAGDDTITIDTVEKLTIN